eukprot:NODE_608_length_1921_cov_16.043269_g487_i0.p2 GENE.NODE_608_length_1921_cov_16.043269_g487_i0~~NODE_608_length_1921_cov_16.043269_g487_i0.p2  ORF type:complete len:399 (+),score=17.76 NODE_608_length_1921_cov_16.043269_g487_i0:602-1798(+)
MSTAHAEYTAKQGERPGLVVHRAERAASPPFEGVSTAHADFVPKRGDRWELSREVPSRPHIPFEGTSTAHAEFTAKPLNVPLSRPSRPPSPRPRQPFEAESVTHTDFTFRTLSCSHVHSNLPPPTLTSPDARAPAEQMPTPLAPSQPPAREPAPRTPKTISQRSRRARSSVPGASSSGRFEAITTTQAEFGRKTSRAPSIASEAAAQPRHNGHATSQRVSQPALPFDATTTNRSTFIPHALERPSATPENASRLSRQRQPFEGTTTTQADFRAPPKTALAHPVPLIRRSEASSRRSQTPRFDAVSTARSDFSAPPSYDTATAPPAGRSSVANRLPPAQGSNRGQTTETSTTSRSAFAPPPATSRMTPVPIRPSAPRAADGPGTSHWARSSSSYGHFLS